MIGVTTYQLELLKLLDEIEKKTGKPSDFDQLLEDLSWHPSKASAQFTIRSVIGKGLMKKGELEQRRGRWRVTFHLTKEGRKVLDPRVPVEETHSGKHEEKATEEFVPELLEPVQNPDLDDPDEIQEGED